MKERRKIIKGNTGNYNIFDADEVFFLSLPSACVEIKVILATLDSVHILYHS